MQRCRTDRAWVMEGACVDAWRERAWTHRPSFYFIICFKSLSFLSIFCSDSLLVQIKH
jgi:hypothetical protein